MTFIVLHLECPESLRHQIEGDLHQLRRDYRAPGVRICLEEFRTAEQFQQFLAEQAQQPTLHESHSDELFESNQEANEPH